MNARALALTAFLAAAPLAACSSLPILLGGIGQTAPQTLADAEKALTLAHLAYQGAGMALQNAAKSGALHGADAAAAKTLYDKAGAALDTADAADAAANATDLVAAVASANAVLVQLHALIAKS